MGRGAAAHVGLELRVESRLVHRAQGRRDAGQTPPTHERLRQQALHDVGARRDGRLHQAPERPRRNALDRGVDRHDAAQAVRRRRGGGGVRLCGRSLRGGLLRSFFEELDLGMQQLLREAVAPHVAGHEQRRTLAQALAHLLATVEPLEVDAARLVSDDGLKRALHTPARARHAEICNHHPRYEGRAEANLERPHRHQTATVVVARGQQKQQICEGPQTPLRQGLGPARTHAGQRRQRTLENGFPPARRNERLKLRQRSLHGVAQRRVFLPLREEGCDRLESPSCVGRNRERRRALRRRAHARREAAQPRQVREVVTGRELEGPPHGLEHLGEGAGGHAGMVRSRSAPCNPLSLRLHRRLRRRFRPRGSLATTAPRSIRDAGPGCRLPRPARLPPS